jgi:hypothetical protein
MLVYQRVSPRNKRVKKPQLPSHDPVTMIVQQGKTFTEPWLDDCPFITGWWYTYPSENYEFVSWDDDIPNIWKNNPNVPPTRKVLEFCSSDMIQLKTTTWDQSHTHRGAILQLYLQETTLHGGSAIGFRSGSTSSFRRNRWTRRPKWLQTQLNGRNTLTIYPRPTHSYLTTPKNLRVD